MNIKINDIKHLLPYKIPAEVGMFYENSPVFPIGDDWFKCKDDGKCYRIGKIDGVYFVTETRQSIKNVKATAETTCTILCETCGSERTIQTQDRFQVKKCKECQLELNREKRRNRYKRDKDRNEDIDKAKDQEAISKLKEALNGFKPNNQGSTTGESRG